MLYGDICTVHPDRGFAFVRVTDPTSEEFGHRFFMHSNNVESTSEVSFCDARLHDCVQFEIEDTPRGPIAVGVYISERAANERVTGVIKNVSSRGFAFVTVGDQDYFCHRNDCDWELSQEDVGADVECELVESGRDKPACIAVRKV